MMSPSWISSAIPIGRGKSDRREVTRATTPWTQGHETVRSMSKVDEWRSMSYVKHKATGSSIIAVIVNRRTAMPIMPNHIRDQSIPELGDAPLE